ncbi:PopZ family protein [Lichenifustis flavocetrariae]|uniref:DUF2497 domain-containing protein n=1 Tax=Lichenifustis flavocetrariae TaxID=2949735 RepID=A0AA41YYD5_9HYPH|nr:DUF2497 domain-containing protein [Lichenifustis flavocetrariae]MCW6507163.1 DUF2497 domain-containing protein [Lichenifustis flavocetrariae]
MEDILASIRRIIAEDQSNSLGRSGLGGLTRRTPPVAPHEPDVAPAQASEDLSAPTDDMSSSIALQETPEHVEASHGDMLRGSYAAAPETLYEAAEPAHEIEPPVDTDAAESHDVGDQGVDHRPTFALSASDHDDDYQDDVEPLISPVAGASITSSFQTLAESVMLQDPGLVERIMRETLRPMLKTWLDDHLPSIVERLVRAEIERVARGGRSRD